MHGSSSTHGKQGKETLTAAYVSVVFCVMFKGDPDMTASIPIATSQTWFIYENAIKKQYKLRRGIKKTLNDWKKTVFAQRKRGCPRCCLNVKFDMFISFSIHSFPYTWSYPPVEHMDWNKKTSNYERVQNSMMVSRNLGVLKLLEF